MKALILVASTKAPARDPDALLPPHIIECTPAKLYRSLDMVRPLVWAFVDHPDTPEAVRYACVVDACKQRPGSPAPRNATASVLFRTEVHGTVAIVSCRRWGGTLDTCSAGLLSTGFTTEAFDYVGLMRVFLGGRGREARGWSSAGGYSANKCRLCGGSFHYCGGQHTCACEAPLGPDDDLLSGRDGLTMDVGYLLQLLNN